MGRKAGRRALMMLGHLVNIGIAVASLATCPAGKRGERCALHAGISLAIEALGAADDALQT